MAEGGPELEVCVLGEGVEVGADGAFEEGGVLGDDGEAGAEVLETDVGDVLVVDYYRACAGCGVSMVFVLTGLRWVVLTAGDLIEPEQGGDDTRLSSARPADDANVLATLDMH